MKRYTSYYVLIIVGFGMAIGTFIKLMGVVHIDSDWFWFLAGVGLGIEGIVSLAKQKTFDKKYIIVERETISKKKNK